VYNCNEGKGCIVNLSNNVLQGEIVGKYEILGYYTQYPIRKDIKGKLKNIMNKNPPERDIYPGNKDLQFDIPVPQSWSFATFPLFVNLLLQCSYSLSLLCYFSEISNTLNAICYSLLPLNSVIGFI
jgi:hypothetical protein